jgi:hypothetical protein
LKKKLKPQVVQKLLKTSEPSLKVFFDTGETTSFMSFFSENILTDYEALSLFTSFGLKRNTP